MQPSIDMPILPIKQNQYAEICRSNSMDCFPGKGCEHIICCYQNSNSNYEVVHYVRMSKLSSQNDQVVHLSVERVIKLPRKHDDWWYWKEKEYLIVCYRTTPLVDPFQDRNETTIEIFNPNTGTNYLRVNNCMRAYIDGFFLSGERYLTWAIFDQKNNRISVFRLDTNKQPFQENESFYPLPSCFSFDERDSIQVGNYIVMNLVDKKLQSYIIHIFDLKDLKPHFSVGSFSFDSMSCWIHYNFLPILEQENAFLMVVFIGQKSEIKKYVEKIGVAPYLVYYEGYKLHTSDKEYHKVYQVHIHNIKTINDYLIYLKQKASALHNKVKIWTKNRGYEELEDLQENINTLSDPGEQDDFKDVTGYQLSESDLTLLAKSIQPTPSSLRMTCRFLEELTTS